MGRCGRGAEEGLRLAAGWVRGWGGWCGWVAVWDGGGRDCMRERERESSQLRLCERSSLHETCRRKSSPTSESTLQRP